MGWLGGDVELKNCTVLAQKAPHSNAAKSPEFACETGVST
jgi:hypothetical protein